mgnify:CR=1 FL=1
MKKDFLKINELNYTHINYGFFTRVGGFSKNNYSSLNCNLSSEDKPQIVKKNIQFAMDLLSLKNKKLKLPKQIHSNIIEEIHKKICSEIPMHRLYLCISYRYEFDGSKVC